MHQLADPGQTLYLTPYVGKASEQVNVIQKSDNKAFGGPGKL
jgi:hypothetical protein